jgi:hypothetical protein
MRNNQWNSYLLDLLVLCKLYQAGREFNNEKLHQAGADFARRTLYIVLLLKKLRIY